MKKKGAGLALLVVAALAAGGCASLELAGSRFISSTTKLDRTVTLFADDGSVIQSWTGPMYLKEMGAGITFMLDGKRINICGTYIVTENP